MANEPIKNVQVMTLQTEKIPEEWAAVQGLVAHFSKTVVAPDRRVADAATKKSEGFLAQIPKIEAKETAKPQAPPVEKQKQPV